MICSCHTVATAGEVMPGLIIVVITHNISSCEIKA